MKKHLLSLLFLAALSAPVQALDFYSYNELASQRAKILRQPHVVFFYADWCSICKGQKKNLTALQDKDLFPGVTVFLADFDNERELKKKLKVERQSTLILYKGRKEVDRSVGMNDQAKLEEFIKKSM